MPDPDRAAQARREALFAAAFFVAVFVYLFLHQESELQHWLTLVLLPLFGLWLVGGRPPIRTLVASLGLERGRLWHGLKWPLVLGFLIQGVQFLNPSNREAIASVLGSSYGWIFPLVALPLLMITVGPTEEIFFRGILQRRFTDASGREGWRADAEGIALATVAFILFHVPYAYLGPNWPSYGDLPHAFRLAALNGALGGVVLGLIYVKSGRNLMAVILLHAMVDWVPGTIMVSRIKFGGG